MRQKNYTVRFNPTECFFMVNGQNWPLFLLIANTYHVRCLEQTAFRGASRGLSRVLSRYAIPVGNPVVASRLGGLKVYQLLDWALMLPPGRLRRCGRHIFCVYVCVCESFWCVKWLLSYWILYKIGINMFEYQFFFKSIFKKNLQ